MAVIGTPRTFHKKFKFIVEIDGVASAGFQKASELSVEVANVQYSEGGALIPNQSPGRLVNRRPERPRVQTQPRHRPSGPRRLDASPLVAHGRMAREVRRRRVG